MVRLLQIAGVGALVVAGVVLASLNPWRPLGFLRLGISQDPEAVKFMNAQGAVTQFNTRKDSQVPDDQDKIPPLERQARTLESIINPRIPPPTQTSVATTNRGPTTPVLKPPVSANFTLIGISYLPSDPESSFAYIRLPDNTFQWVRQGNEVGHLTIKQVKNDSIICFDGQKMSEMKVEATVDTASLLEGGSAPSDPTATMLKGTVSQPVSQPGVRAPLSDRITAGSSPALANLTAEEEASLRELANRVKELKASKSNQADSNATAAEIDRLISEAKSSRISPEEAQKLDKLGEQAEEKRREAMRRMGPPPRPPKQ